MKKVTARGQTVEEAVERAAQELGVGRERLEITVLQEPSKGFFGWRQKPAIIEAVLVEEEGKEDEEKAPVQIDKAVRFLEEVLPLMGLKEVKVEARQGEGHVLIQLSGKELGLAIGRRGQTLDALQYLTNVIANRKEESFVSFVLDAENYRERRKKTLEQLADRLAKEVIRTREKIALEPMTAQERKIIHTHLQNYAGVTTKSEGEEPNRRVVLWPK